MKSIAGLWKGAPAEPGDVHAECRQQAEHQQIHYEAEIQRLGELHLSQLAGLKAELADVTLERDRYKTEHEYDLKRFDGLTRQIHEREDLNFQLMQYALQAQAWFEAFKRSEPGTHKQRTPHPPGWLDKAGSRFRANGEARNDRALPVSPIGYDGHAAIPSVMMYTDGEHYKIGVTTDVTKRLAAHQTSNAKRLSVVCTFETMNAYDAEAWLHNRYARKHELGEWFSLDAHDLAVLRDIAQRDTLDQVILDCERT